MLSTSQLNQIKKHAAKVLRLHGNRPQGQVVEMSLIIDCALLHANIIDDTKSIFTALRNSSAAFKNLRVSLFKWKCDEKIDHYVTSYPEIQMGRTCDPSDIFPEESDIAVIADTADTSQDSDISQDSDTEEDSDIADTADTSQDSDISQDSDTEVDVTTDAAVDYEENPPVPDKQLDTILHQLMKSAPKTKLVIFLTKKERCVCDTELAAALLETNLYKKIITVFPDGKIEYPLSVKEPEDPSDSDS